MEKEELYQKIKAILGCYEGLEVRDKKKGDGGFRFPVYIQDKYKDTDISALLLSERAHNCLKRGEIHTIYDLMTKINGRLDLKKIRGCGDGTSREIMEALFVFQFSMLKPEQHEFYINKIVEMNRK